MRRLVKEKIDVVPVKVEDGSAIYCGFRLETVLSLMLKSDEMTEEQTEPQQRSVAASVGVGNILNPTRYLQAQ